MGIAIGCATQEFVDVEFVLVISEIFFGGDKNFHDVHLTRVDVLDAVDGGEGALTYLFYNPIIPNSLTDE
jgi:hypothetical protein